MNIATLDPLPHQLDKHRGQYSLTTVLRKAGETGGSRTTGRVNGLELEVHQELAKRTGIEPRGVLVPLDAPVFPRSGSSLERRDLTSTSGAGAVSTRTDAVALIDVLRSKSVCASLGARTVPIGVGNLAMPRRATGAQVAWLAEGAAASQSNATIDQVQFVPKLAGAFTDTNRVMLSSQASLIAILIDDLVGALGTDLDRVALNGGGTNEPTGIRGTAGIQTLALGANGLAPTWANVCEMERLLGVANADVGQLGWATTPAARSRLRRTEKVAGSGLIWGDDDRMAGMTAMATTGLPSNITKGTSGATLSSLVLGNFDDLVIGVWGAIDLVIDAFKFSTLGVIRCHAFLACDVKLRHPESFVVANDVVTV